MKYLFLGYPNCSTSQKAKKWLKKLNPDFTDRDIVQMNPTIEELEEWIPRSGKPLKSFFNTSGVSYKLLNLKEKLPLMNEHEQIELLATDGKLIKRPLLVTDDFVLVGFKQEEWENLVK